MRHVGRPVDLRRPAGWRPGGGAATRRARSRLGVASVLFVALFALADVGAQEREPGSAEVAPPATGADPRAQVREGRAALEAERAVLRGELQDATTPPGVAASLSAELDLLDRLDRLYLDQLDALGRAEVLERGRTEVERTAAAGVRSQLTGSPPYPLALVDALTDALNAQRGRIATVEAAVTAAREALADAKEAFERAEQDRRRAKEEAEGAPDGIDGADAREELRLARIESRVADQRHELARLQLDNTEADLAIQRQSASLLEATVRWLDANLAPTREEVTEPLARIEKEEFDTRRALEQAKLELTSVERRHASTRERVDASSQPDAVLLAEAEARRLALQTAQRRVAFLNDRIQRLEFERGIWQRRFRMLSGEQARSDLREWEKELREWIDGAGRERRLKEARLSELRSDLGTTRARAGAEGAEQRWLGHQTRQLDTLVGLYEQDLAGLARNELLARRAVEEVHRRTARVTWGEQIRDAASRIGAVWGTELFAVDDRPITTGKIFAAILIFVLGYVAARFASRALYRALFTRLNVDAGAAHAFQTLSLYLLVVIFFLFALRTVNIPLTAFAILGGAFAIGVGFGSQNVINNFISGLILLAERPIKVGDIVVVDEAQGRVERIGLRSTQVRTFDNVDIIVPNASFLERNVVNWTLTDDVVRTRVDVGVAYGSPTRDVQRLIQKALDEHGQILKVPEPQVFFSDFGDSALVFRAYFWVRVRVPVARLRIESDVRYRIDHLFRESGITIAFPQRDVHIDTLRPVEIRLLGSEGDEGEGEPPPS